MLGKGLKSLRNIVAALLLRLRPGFCSGPIMDSETQWEALNSELFRNFPVISTTGTQSIIWIRFRAKNLTEFKVETKIDSLETASSRKKARKTDSVTSHQGGITSQTMLIRTTEMEDQTAEGQIIKRCHWAESMLK